MNAVTGAVGAGVLVVALLTMATPSVLAQYGASRGTATAAPSVTGNAAGRGVTLRLPRDRMAVAIDHERLLLLLLLLAGEQAKPSPGGLQR